MEVSLWLLEVVIVIFLGMGVVAFVTLLERKLLGLSQLRLGPNKVSFMGLLQPVFDGVKLLLKEFLYVVLVQGVIFLLSPIGLLLVFMVFWGFIMPWAESGLYLGYNCVLLLFSLLGCGSYFVMMAGWSCTSIFSKLGGLRSLLQSLSFEVALVLVLLMPLILLGSLMMINSVCLGIEMIFWMLIWLMICLMESNRAPFDLLEGESELISGFNIETSSVIFVFIFLSEYGSLVSLSMLVSLVLLGVLSILFIISVSVLLFIRSCYPRIRYDVLMSTMWQSMLPISLLLTLVMVFIK